MNPAGAFIQIVLLIVSVVIGVTYLKPTFLEIQTLQDEKQRYIDERTRVDEVNRLLQSLVNEYESVSIENLRRLNDYIPDTVDKLEFMRTLMAIGDESEMNMVNISIEGDGSYTSGGNTKSEYQTSQFSVTMTGAYNNLKPFLARLERNVTPVLVTNIDISPDFTVNVAGADEEESVLVNLSLVTFSLPAVTAQPN